MKHVEEEQDFGGIMCPEDAEAYYSADSVGWCHHCWTWQRFSDARRGFDGVQTNAHLCVTATCDQSWEFGVDHVMKCFSGTAWVRYQALADRKVELYRDGK